MKNILSWAAVFAICLAGGAMMIIWPLVAFIMWDPLWLMDIGGWPEQERFGLLIFIGISGFAVYQAVRHGWVK